MFQLNKAKTIILKLKLTLFLRSKKFKKFSSKLQQVRNLESGKFSDKW
ncbi:hypothetical protein RHK27_04660 [Clostridioides difficile]|nr:hypothetical protein [Clostridioides difficile]